jgi:hypothetical protein
MIRLIFYDSSYALNLKKTKDLCSCEVFVIEIAVLFIKIMI